MKESKSPIKSAIWYTAGNFFNRAIGIILTPIMTRILSTDEYGDFTNFTVWSGLLMVITSLDIGNVIVRAKYDHEDSFDEYLSSVSVATLVSTALWFLIVLLFKNFFISFFDMNFSYIILMFIYLLFTPACNYFAARERVLYRYKAASLITVLTTLASAILSILFVYIMQDRILGRTLGYVLPTALTGIVLYGIFIFKGRKVVLSMIKYTLLLSIPLIPHNLSNGILNSSDRIVIKKFYSSTEVAIYGFGYSLGNFLYIFTSSVWQAYTPWLFDKLHNKEISSVRKANSVLPFFMLAILTGALLIMPELIQILGGKKYIASITFLPVIVIGIYIQFLSGLNIGIESYTKQTHIISIASAIAAAVNFSLNLILVPIYGYQIAALTTVLGFVAAFILHSIVVIRSPYKNALPIKKYIFVSLLCIIVTCLITLLYSSNSIRYCFMTAYLIIMAYILYRIIHKTKKGENLIDIIMSITKSEV